MKCKDCTFFTKTGSNRGECIRFLAVGGSPPLVPEDHSCAAFEKRKKIVLTGGLLIGLTDIYLDERGLSALLYDAFGRLGALSCSKIPVKITIERIDDGNPC